jgi:hypothetical protein
MPGQSNFDDITLTTNSSSVPIPEPSELLLLCMGLFSLALFLGYSRPKSQLNSAVAS